jgi:transposase
MSRAEELKAKQLDEAEWRKMYYKHQQQYIRKRLEAIKYLQEGKSRQEVLDKVGCARQSLVTWIDMYCQGGLIALCTPVKSNKKQKLGDEEKTELRKMLLEQKPIDYGIDRQLWTAKIILEVIQKRWGVELKDSRIYDILKELGLSHQKAHRDYLNASLEAQQQFVITVKKTGRAETKRKVAIL